MTNSRNKGANSHYDIHTKDWELDEEEEE